MDNVLVDFQSGLDRIDEETKNQYRAKVPGDKDRLDEIPGLFGKMDPMPGAIEAVHKLAEVYDVIIRERSDEDFQYIHRSPNNSSSFWDTIKESMFPNKSL